MSGHHSDIFLALGAPAELLKQAASLPALPSPQANNAHIHLPPNFSAFTTARQAVELAAKEKVVALGTANYYDYTVYQSFAQEARQAGIFPIFGLEILSMDEELRLAGVKVNDPGNPGKFYICGKAIALPRDGFSPRAQRAIEGIRGHDAIRIAEMIDRMEFHFADHGYPTTLSYDGIVQRVVNRHGCPAETVFLQERHVAQAFQEVLFEKVGPADRLAILNQILGAPTKAKQPADAVTIQNDLRSHVMKAGKPAYVPEPFITIEQARRLILDLGGIPCYPTLADGASPICGFEEPVDECIGRLKSRSIHAAELIPVRNSPEVLTHYAQAFRGAGMIVTAGTEHNSLDLIPLQPACVKGAAIPAEVAAIFWEGALVLIAHQYLTAHSKVGYVTPTGQPNPEFKSHHDRITTLAKLGAVVLRKYQG